MELIRANDSPRIARKTVTFTGAVNLGQAASAVTVFNITGYCLLEKLLARCTANLTEDPTPGGATVDLKGADGYTFIGTTNSLDLDAGDSWIDTTPAETTVGLIPAAMKDVTLNGGAGGSNISINCATDDTTGGTLEIYAVWRPLSSNGAITPA